MELYDAPWSYDLERSGSNGQPDSRLPEESRKYGKAHSMERSEREVLGMVLRSINICL
jgi:hypothetical protein